MYYATQEASAETNGLFASRVVVRVLATAAAATVWTDGPRPFEAIQDLSAVKSYSLLVVSIETATFVGSKKENGGKPCDRPSI